MILIDKEIEKMINFLRIEVSDKNVPFNSEEQIQPASIDLRLDKTIWIPNKHKIDLRNSSFDDLTPRKYYRKKMFKDSDPITLEPGVLYLSRIYEKLTIPPNYIGLIVGKSSVSRLGISIHCDSNYLNPGYVGHMPLQIINMSPSKIIIPPYIQICQLIIIKLSDQPRKFYGHSAMHHKYINDDGGPSKIWRDISLRRLQTHLAELDDKIGLMNSLTQFIAENNFEKEVIDRFDKYINKKKWETDATADIILHGFSKTENRRKIRRWILINGSRYAFPSIIVELIYNYINGDTSWEFSSTQLIIRIIIMIILFIPFMRSLHTNIGYCFTESEYKKNIDKLTIS